MFITNLDSVPGQQITKSLGIVRGQASQADHRIARLLEVSRQLLGGELNGCTEVFRRSREEALLRMESQARSLGANGILNVRFLAAGAAWGQSQLAVLGTAVVLE